MPDQAWESMFEQATAFNEPIGDWNTASVSDTRVPMGAAAVHKATSESTRHLAWNHIRQCADW